jgi:hypothetical protein
MNFFTFPRKTTKANELGAIQSFSNGLLVITNLTRGTCDFSLFLGIVK